MEYYIKDHLGNTRVIFSDLDNDGKIEVDPSSGNSELLSSTDYYPFGMAMEGSWDMQTSPQNDYLYNGKELDKELGLNLQHYGARLYDNVLGRFTGVDPISEQFPHVSTFNYAENEPVANIDLWGLQKVSINDTRNSGGQITQRSVNVSINMKILNLSSKDNFQLNNSLNRASTSANRSFSTSFQSKVLDSPQTGMTTNEVPVNVKFQVSIQQVSNLDQVKDTDFVSLVVNKVDNKNEDGNVAGWGLLNDNLTILEADEMTGSSPELILHELGHNLGLNHTKNGAGLMGANMNKQTNISRTELKTIYQGMPVTGQEFHRQYDNDQTTIKDFLNDNSTNYDNNKAKKSGIK